MFGRDFQKQLLFGCILTIYVNIPVMAYKMTIRCMEKIRERYGDILKFIYLWNENKIDNPFG